jgi:group I intron endonuclease
MTKYGRIYIIRNTVNKKVYIGQTHVSIKLRFQNHLSAARRGLDYVIGKAIRKYGEDKFYVELLEECTTEELNDREKYWIAFFNSTNNKFGYNMSIGGNVVRTTNDLDETLVLNMFKQGNTSTKIAKILHVNPYKIATILKKNNIIYGIDKQRIDKVTESMTIDLYLDGYSTVDIGKKFGINKSTVIRVLKRNNIKLRTFKETKNLKRNLSTLQ